MVHDIETDKPLRKSNEIDQRVGARLRERRNALHLSQEQVGDRLGLTFQQIQKYEKGTNRISASRLYELSRILDVDIDYFFDGIDGRDDQLPAGQSPVGMGFAEATAGFDGMPIEDAKRLVADSFMRISDPQIRQSLFQLVMKLAGSGFTPPRA